MITSGYYPFLPLLLLSMTLVVDHIYFRAKAVRSSSFELVIKYHLYAIIVIFLILFFLFDKYILIVSCKVFNAQVHVLIFKI